MEKAVLSTLPIAASSAPSLDLDPSIATWGVLGALVIAMLAIDLLVFARDHTPPTREAVSWSVVWLVVAAGFGALFWAWQGAEAGGQFFAGYLLERTLSLDNVFVFAVIMASFAVPADVQPKVLSWGIALALVLRLVLILAGATLLDSFHATFYVFGALLLFTAWKLVRREGQEAAPDRTRALRLLPRRLRARPLVVLRRGRPTIRHRLRRRLDPVRRPADLRRRPARAAFVVFAPPRGETFTTDHDARCCRRRHFLLAGGAIGWTPSSTPSPSTRSTCASSSWLRRWRHPRQRPVTNRTADCAARQLIVAALALAAGAALAARAQRLAQRRAAHVAYQGVSLNLADPGSDLLGGTQDNGTWAFNPSAGAPGGFDAFESVGGDGGVSSIGVDQVKVHTYYGPTMDANFGGNEGDTDSPRTWDYISEPLDAAAGDPDNPETFAFYVPLIHDPSPSRKGTLFTGGQFVWRTTDNGGPSDQLDAHCRETALSVGDSSRVCGDWQRIGRRLSAGATQAEGAGDYVVAVERAPSNDQTLWAGTRQGHLWISRNANAADPAAVQFTAVDAAGLPGRFPSSITIDPGNPNHAWVSCSGYSAYTPTTPGHVFDVRVNPDTGAATAVDLSFDLGDQPVTDVVRDDQTRALYASTDFGVLTLALNGTSWTKAADGMPIVAVYGLTVDPGARLLYAATHGRGVWRVNLPGGTAPADGRADTRPRRGRALRRRGDRAERRPQPRAGGLALAQSTDLAHQPPA